MLVERISGSSSMPTTSPPSSAFRSRKLAAASIPMADRSTRRTTEEGSSLPPTAAGRSTSSPTDPAGSNWLCLEGICSTPCEWQSAVMGPLPRTTGTPAGRVVERCSSHPRQWRRSDRPHLHAVFRLQPNHSSSRKRVSWSARIGCCSISAAGNVDATRRFHLPTSAESTEPCDRRFFPRHDGC